MAEDWAVDVKKYAPDADDSVIASIVRYCGIALRNRDSSLVSFSDPVEVGRVRENYCRKKLGLTEPDADVDAVIARVGQRMGGDTTKNRVTVYYLLAHEFGKLGLFGAAAAAAATAATSTAAAPAPVMSSGAATTERRAAASHAAVERTVVGPAAVRRPDGGSGLGTVALAAAGVMGAIIIGTATFGSLIAKRGEPAAVAAVDGPPIFTAAPAPAAVPEGAAAIAQELAGKPGVSVYFDTAKTDVSPDFAAAAAPVKTWLDEHPGARLSVSGYNDPRGDAAMNAELSKNRAKAVAASLATLGISADAIDLDKPPETTDTDVEQSQARRVDVTIKDAS